MPLQPAINVHSLRRAVSVRVRGAADFVAAEGPPLWAVPDVPLSASVGPAILREMQLPVAA